MPLKKCSVCAVAAYCGAACQKADWKLHKGQCTGLKASAAAVPGMQGIIQPHTPCRAAYQLSGC